MRVTPVLFLFCAMLLAACHANDSARRAGSPTAEARRSDAAGDEGLAVAFYADDRDDADVRARTESHHFDRSADGGVSTTAAPVADPVAAPVADPAARERMLIQTGQVRVEVPHPDELMASFRAQVVAWGGHLQSQADTTLTVRVPASRFDEAFEWVKRSGRVLSESRQAQDVTEEFLDLGIRIENARRSRERLLEILQKADKVEDILKVEAQLRRLTEEIERMEGRKKFLADQVTLATLQATFQPITEAPPAKRRRQPSRFDWINRIGAERVMEDFR